MLKKLFSILLIVLVTNLGVVTAFAETKEEKEAKFAEKVKANIVKLGTGKNVRVEVTLKSRTKLKGYVSQINEDNFVITDENGNATEVPYSQTKKVKGIGRSAWIALAVGVGILVVVIIGVKAASKE